MDGMKIVYLRTDQLIPYEANAKQHPDDQVEHIANSIREFGFRQPIVVDHENVVVIGHGRLLAAKKLGMDKVPCIRADDLSEAQIRALRLADNKTNESPWDWKTLESELENLEIHLDMAQFGFNDEQPVDVDSLFTEQPEDAPEEEQPKQIQCPHCGEWFTP